MNFKIVANQLDVVWRLLSYIIVKIGKWMIIRGNTSTRAAI
jgi:hypothetical protein